MYKNNKILKVKKREGWLDDFDQKKIMHAILKAIRSSLHREDLKLAERLSDFVVEALNKKYSTKNIPTVEEIQDIVIEILKKKAPKEVFEEYASYRAKRAEIRKLKYYLISYDVKVKLSENALRILESRYLQKDENGKIIETPTQLFQRVAHNIAEAEKIYNPSISDDDLFKVEEDFFKIMARLEFLPNSPTLMNAGNPLQQLSACFVIEVNDSIDSIFESLKNTAKIHQSGGGTGFDFSNLRPKNDIVKSTAGIASGPISFMEIFDKATEVVKQGGKRRGANMGILRVDHPDILDFITSKMDQKRLQNFNISVAVTNDFMEAVLKDKEYELINPRNNQPVKKLKAKDIFDTICKIAWETGDPGLIFLDEINNEKGNPTPSLGRIKATNPCGEVPLLSYESCNLGSINLVKMLKETKANKFEIDWEKLERTIKIAVRFLDNVVDMNRYPLPEIEKMSRGNRRIGLGVMGFADMLIKIEISYDSDKAVKLAGKLMKFIDEKADYYSQQLAKERGVFPNYRDSIFYKKKIKMRNCATTTIAPTGTIGLIAGVSQGIEPIFAIAYERYSYIGRESDKPVKLIEVNPLFEEIAKREKFYSKELMQKVLQNGSVRGLKEVPLKWQKIFATAHDISPEYHLRMQAAFQKYTDNGVSKTVNLPHSATVEDVKNIYLLAYKLKCKGITIFRSGSKQMQILNIGVKNEETKQEDEKSLSKQDKETPPQFKNPSNEGPDVPPGICLTCL